MPSRTSRASSPSSPGPGRSAGTTAPEPVPGGVPPGSVRPVGPSPELTHTDLTDLTGLVGRVLAIGHSSGRDLLSGVSGALRAVDALPSASRHPHPHEGAHRG